MAPRRIPRSTCCQASLGWGYDEGYWIALIIACDAFTYSFPGKLLTTPSRLLKLIIPLTTMDKNTDRKDIEPLALLGW